ncbi:dihydrodipicolinate synthase family protein [Microbacterium faecale]|uniref:Dihydrodipicolinate synthase family protein n=1 Tax=Microbacterium faecale TaxID=1804630 RepID=A0A916YGJ1_9MICO|nr:dihydrodipicolinate synthase family protein [Microbacterium faecale]GGD44409.1 dihydrodipicolinate synthase family protein [Microbacterium faecale]
MQFTGVSAFPLTPFVDDRIDEGAYAGLIQHLARSDVSSITSLGSTGSYAYLSSAERAAAVSIAVTNAGTTPVLAGIGATRTRDVVENAASAAEAGARGLLLAAVSYQPLGDDEVFGLFRDVAASTDLPIVVYDNPRTTGYTFTPEMYARVSELPGIASLKVPGRPLDEARDLLQRIRSLVPEHVSVCFSGDSFATDCRAAGYDGWYSVLAGTLPDLALATWDSGSDDALQPLWDLYTEAGGGLRVMAAIAERKRWAAPGSLPRPLIGLSGEQRERLVRILDGIDS